MFIYPVRSDYLDFDSSTREGMRGVLGAELKFMGYDRKLSLLPPAPPQPHRERACTQARKNVKSALQVLANMAGGQRLVTRALEKFHRRSVDITTQNNHGLRMCQAAQCDVSAKQSTVQPRSQALSPFPPWDSLGTPLGGKGEKAWERGCPQLG